MWRPEVDCVFLIIPHIFYWDRVFHWSGSLSIPAGLPSHLLPESPSFVSPVLRLWIDTMPFQVLHWFWKSELQYLCLNSKYFIQWDISPVSICAVTRIRKGYIIWKHFQYHSVYLFNGKTTYVLYIIAGEKAFLICGALQKP